jgi:DNA-directed RNA polymerase specialized sigma24 family protein
MSSPGSVSEWLVRLKGGDEAVLQPLWERYFRRLVGLARTRLAGSPRRGSDEEDVALSAFDSFYQRAEAGKFPQLNDREDLWRVLMVITSRKALRLLRDERRQKRGGNLSIEECNDRELEQVIGDEPTPEFAVQVAEQVAYRLDRLPDQFLRSIALGKLEGYTNEELAAQFRCAPRTIERKLCLIRGLWESDELP